MGKIPPPEAQDWMVILEVDRGTTAMRSWAAAMFRLGLPASYLLSGSLTTPRDCDFRSAECGIADSTKQDHQPRQFRQKLMQPHVQGTLGRATLGDLNGQMKLPPDKL